MSGGRRVEAEDLAEGEASWWLQATDYPWDNASCDAVTCGNASALANATQRVPAPQLHAIDRIQFWVTPALVVFGCLGNVVSVWVFHSTKLRTLSSSCYLAALAASDTAFLLTLFLVWLSMVGYDLLNQPGWCQAINYAIYVSTFLSVWLVVAFTVERFIAVCYPLLRAAVCTVRRARLVILVLTAAALLLYSYLLVAAAPGVHPVARRTICKLRDEYVALATAMNYVDTVLTLLLPVATVVTLNVRIARCVWHVERLRHSMTLAHAPHAPAASLCPGGREAAAHDGCKAGGAGSGVVVVAGGRGSQPARVRSQNKVTKMLLIISTVFILLNLPSYVMRAYIFFWVSLRGTRGPKKEREKERKRKQQRKPMRPNNVLKVTTNMNKDLPPSDMNSTSPLASLGDGATQVPSCPFPSS